MLFSNARQGWLTATVLLGVVSMLAACSAGEAAGGGADDLTDVTLAVGTNDLNIGYPYATLPLATGCYEEQGLNVDLIESTDSATVAQLLISGRAEVGLMNPDQGVAIAAKGDNENVKSVYAVSRKSSYKVLVPEGGSFHSPEDLKGKKIGQLAVGSGGGTFSRVLYSSAGFTEDDVEEVVVGYGAPAMDAMRSGEIDAYVTFSSMLPRLEAEGYQFDTLPDPDFVEDMYGWDLYASAERIEELSDTITGVGRCFAEASVFLKENPEAGVAAFWETYPDRAPSQSEDQDEIFARDFAIQQAQLNDMLLEDLDFDFEWGSQETDVWESTIRYFESGGENIGDVTPEMLFDDSFRKGFNDFDRAEVRDLARNWESHD